MLGRQRNPDSNSQHLRWKFLKWKVMWKTVAWRDPEVLLPVLTWQYWPRWTWKGLIQQTAASKVPITCCFFFFLASFKRNVGEDIYKVSIFSYQLFPTFETTIKKRRLWQQEMLCKRELADRIISMLMQCPPLLSGWGWKVSCSSVNKLVWFKDSAQATLMEWQDILASHWCSSLLRFILTPNLGLGFV